MTRDLLASLSFASDVNSQGNRNALMHTDTIGVPAELGRTDVVNTLIRFAPLAGTSTYSFVRATISSRVLLLNDRVTSRTIEMLVWTSDGHLNDAVATSGSGAWEESSRVK
jgi:hypothetical protein